MFIDEDIPSEEVDKRIDWLGAFLVTAGLIFVIFALGQGKTASQGWATPCKSSKFDSRSNLEMFSGLIGISDIIALLVLGVITIVLFLYWQNYLEKIHDNPDSPYSVFTPPPLMKLSIWTRANGRIAAMMTIGFVQRSAFFSWSFWVHVRLPLMLS